MAEQLPLELWRQLPRTTLCALMLVNRALSQVSAPLYYDSLTIKFWNTQSLQDVVSENAETGLGRRFMSYAKKIRLICLPQPDPDALENWIMKDWATDLIYSPVPASMPMDTFLEPHILGPSSVPELKILSGRYAVYKDRDWDPVASLISRRARLEVLDFIVQNDFSASLQQAIDQYHPGCRIDIWWRQGVGYSAPTLRQRLSANQVRLRKEHEFDFNVLRLQGLHNLAISTISEWVSAESDANDLDEISPFIFMAPNLKHLVIQQNTDADTRTPVAMLKEEWRNLTTTYSPTQVARLESITVSTAHERLLLRLTRTFDLSRLKSLDIDEYADPTVLAQLAPVFPNLERLFITVNPIARPGPDAYADIPDAITAIKAFEPLEHLCLRGLRSVSSLMDILEHHGPSLRGLILQLTLRARPRSDRDTGYKYPELTTADITLVAKHCPSLEELRLQVKRSRGSREECETYKALGGFPALHSLVLDLPYDPREQPILQTSSSAQTDLHILRDVFANAAMDEALAGRIWNLIASSQVSRRLRNLRLVPFGSQPFAYAETYLLAGFARSFLLRGPDERGPLIIEEIGREAKVAWRDEQKAAREGEFQIAERLDRLCRGLWPGGSKDDWLSG
ncbi:hypothetical protein BDW74DRAFT_180777 [Aspergillus multicolor]|uniref:uncharacterized protein n=1 Tax=Aspergillus multicolor TaxID=41759 RepID=UPI003CCE34DC